jgi:hypothetical protein
MFWNETICFKVTSDSRLLVESKNFNCFIPNVTHKSQSWLRIKSNATVFIIISIIIYCNLFVLVQIEQLSEIFTATFKPINVP